MYIAKITDGYDNIISTNYTDIKSTDCTNSEKSIELIIPLFTIIPCGMSRICLISLMVYTLIKPLSSKK